ncbi:MAG TPA: site-2 protease family protein [Methanomicrobia archaeon]|nr:site-2 protease family protein [Methanomicrobia archaeon]
MRASIQVGRVIGIPIRLHVTFLLIFPLMVLMFAQGPAPVGLGDTADFSRPFRYALALVAAFLFFLSLLLHELSHSYVAMKYGTKIRNITLFIFGGLALMEDLPREPDKEWRIAIAGPLMSFVLGGTFLAAHFGLSRGNLLQFEPLLIILFSIGLLNVILGTFNLLPAFPMDGGRVLRAFLAKRVQFLTATKRAVFVGKAFALVMGIMGFMPDPFILITRGEISIPFNPWLSIIAVFLFIAATEEETATVAVAALDGLTVRELMRANNVCVPADMPLPALRAKMIAEKTTDYAVIDGSGEYKGFISLAELKKHTGEPLELLRVADVLPFEDHERGAVIVQQASAIEALKRMSGTSKNILAVVDGESGQIRGIITKRDLVMVVEMLRT